MSHRLSTDNAGGGARTSGIIPGVVLRLTADEAEAVVRRFERGEGAGVDSDTIQLLERYFLENSDQAELSRRYDETLRAAVANA